MYRVFEALDELGAIVEEARGVPMTAGCVVPRGDVLELIDDIKDAIPGELDDAQDVLDARDSLLHEAKAHADSMVSSATTESDSMLNHARSEADRILADAKAQADRMVGEARQHSERMVSEAREESVRIAAAAKREYEASHRPRQGGCRPASRKRQHLLRESRARGHQGTAAPGLADRGRAIGQRRVRPADRRGARRGRPAARRVRHLRRQQARRVRGVPQQHPALGQPRPASTADRGRACTTTRSGSAVRIRRGARPDCWLARRIAAMARQHSQHERSAHPGSPLAVNIARLGRRPGAMFSLHDTVASPSRIGLELIGIAAGRAPGPRSAGRVGVRRRAW